MTREKRYTPGLWRVGAKSHLNIIAANGFRVASTNTGDFRGKEGREAFEYAKANAHLIAAAPELLEALRACIQYIPEQPINCGGMKCREEWCEACNGEAHALKAVEHAHLQLSRARAAIAKAHGEQQ